MDMLNFVLLLFLIGVLSAPSFFNLKIKHKTVNVSPDPWLPEFYYIFLSIIIVSMNWIGHLICKIRYIWRDMRESLFKFSAHICSFFLSSPPHRSGTFKSLKYLFTEGKAPYSYKNKDKCQNLLIFLPKSHKTKPTIGFFNVVLLSPYPVEDVEVFGDLSGRYSTR